MFTGIQSTDPLVYKRMSSDAQLQVVKEMGKSALLQTTHLPSTRWEHELATARGVQFQVTNTV